MKARHRGQSSKRLGKETKPNKEKRKNDQKAQKERQKRKEQNQTKKENNKSQTTPTTPPTANKRKQNQKTEGKGLAKLNILTLFKTEFASELKANSEKREQFTVLPSRI
ncbi:unnamed protein product [Polarella glacialis]|uniref:Uncharacterized protein n=1 Tax=Polarella glacialis TaxID=89957 RepID=A0A813LDT7_POLGL|nr:unnamed protein product [Polarella glacialis]